MTHRIGNLVVIAKENSQQCDFCGKVAELRPYGPHGECICFECGMRDIDATRRMFGAILDPQGEAPDAR